MTSPAPAPMSGKLGGGLQVQLGEDVRAGLFVLAEFFFLIRVVLDEQGGLPVDVEAGDLLRHGIETAADGDRARVHQLQGGRLGIEKIRQRPGGGVDAFEHGDAGGLQLRHRDGAQDGLGDERQGALGADEEVLEDLDLRIEVEERVEGVAHRVFQREVLLDDPHRLVVVPHPALEFLEGIEKFRLLRLELLVGVRIGGIDDRAGRQDEGQGLQGAVGVVLRAAGHAGRVVGDDTAHRRGALGGRVGAELPAVQVEPRVDLPHRRAWLDAHALAAVEDLDVTEVLAHVHQNAVAGGLPGQRRAARAQGYRNTAGCARAERGGDVARVLGLHHSLRRVEVVRRVVGVLQAVDEPGVDRLVAADFGREGVGHIGPLLPGLLTGRRAGIQNWGAHS